MEKTQSDYGILSTWKNFAYILSPPPHHHKELLACTSRDVTVKMDSTDCSYNIVGYSSVV